MNLGEDKIYSLIGKHLLGNLTKDESSELDDWFSEKKKHKIEFEDIVELWLKTGQFKFSEKINTPLALTTVHEKADIKPKNVFRLKIVSQIAAILVLSVLFSGLFSYLFFGNKKAVDKLVYEEVNVAYGTKINIELSDGTTVYLNSGSSLRFSNLFAQNHERKVELKGEGFFKVAKDSKRPFIVTVGELDVKVLGTTFNVNAYCPGSEIDIALVEGKVSIGKANNGSFDRLMILIPNQVAHFDVVRNKIYKNTDIDLDKYIGWTEGKIVFVDDPIQDVIRKIEIWYNVNIRVEDKQLVNYRFTGTFINESLEEILNVLSLTSPLQYSIKPAVKNNDGKYSKREVILKIK